MLLLDYRETYDKQKLDVRALNQNKETIQQTLHSKVYIDYIVVTLKHKCVSSVFYERLY